MGAFLYVAIVAVVIGALVGWFSKCGLAALALRCTIATAMLGITLNLIFGGLPESFSIRYIWTSAIYFFFPYLIFLLAPSLLGGVLACFARRRWTKRPQE
jgi:hypothetical protein